MDKKVVQSKSGELLKTEVVNVNPMATINSAFSDQIPSNFSSLFDMADSDDDNNKGFNYSYLMDVFDYQDDFHFPSDLCDLLLDHQPQQQPPLLMAEEQMQILQSKLPVLSPATTLLESSEVVNTPATPNSSSISSSFNEDLLLKKAVDGDEEEEEEEEENLKKPKKQVKSKKENKNKARQPRFAFMTKSEMDQLDDGYRWRKYGQKAVKNSPFPRSYYRCTSSQCNVKKRVERSFEDHSILVTTYEGTHIHPCPVTPRGSLSAATETPYSFILGNTGGVSGLGVGGGGYLPPIQYNQPQHYELQHQMQQPQCFLGMESAANTTPSSMSHLSSFLDQERRFSPSSVPFFLDGGLLQDIVTPQMLKKPKVE